MAKKPNLKARKALDEMKLEIANENNINLSDIGIVGGAMTRDLVEIGQKQLVEEYKSERSNLDK
ncbi:MAG TPA: small, acid-soluble spore protein, alpha/beta type [Tissierellaceae bacterium]|nr:small, acid-soluble spore protein, alpha/beta type [Tissierellaceae bacterium]